MALLANHRRRMFEEIGGVPRRRLDEADPIFRRWVRHEMRGRRLLAFIAEGPNGASLGSGVVWLALQHPRPRWPGLDRLPYLMSMYTVPKHRHRGVASQIVRSAISWSRRRGYPRIYLYASSMGRPVYARLGFVDGTEMRLELEAEPAARGPAERGRPGDSSRL